MDAADSFQLAASAAAFHHLCGLPALDGKPVLLVLNKIDSPRVLARGDIEATFDIDAARGSRRAVDGDRGERVDRGEHRGGDEMDEERGVRGRG